MRLLSRSFVPLLSVLLAACSGGGEMAELQDYVQRTVNRSPTAIEPLPEFVSYEPFTYSAAGQRSPFDVPVEINARLGRQQRDEVRPDENRVREPLESFALGDLAMVGTLSRGDKTWALIRDGSGTIVRITAGNYMGRNHGRIVNIAQGQIDLVEIVPTGDGGWVERPQTVLLQQ